MDSFTYEERIDHIRQDIKRINKLKSKDIKIKPTKDKTYALEQFQRTVKRYNYKKEVDDEFRIMNSKNPTIKKEITNMKEFMDELTKDNFCKPWSRIGTWAQNNRKKEYYSRLEDTVVKEIKSALPKVTFKYDHKEGVIKSHKILE